MQRQNIHDWFTQTAHNFPDRVAIETKTESFTYSDIERESNRLANCLIERGATQGQLVAVAVDKRLDMVISLLGILKAGLVFVPLDVGYPSAYLVSILSIASPSWFVVGSEGSRILKDVTPVMFCSSRAISADFAASRDGSSV